MKTSIVIALCALAVVSVTAADMKEMLKAEAEKCIASTGADPEKLARLKAGDEQAVDDKIKCFGACFMKATGMMQEDGSVDKEMAKAAVPADAPNRDKIIAAIDTCGDEKGANDCETAHAIGVCLHKNGFHPPQ